MHAGEDIAVVGDAGQHQPVIPEGIGNAGSHIPAGQVAQHHLLPQSLQLLAELLSGILGVSINRGIGNDNTAFLRAVGGPNVVFLQVVAQILFQYGAVQRADDGDIQPGGLLQQLLHLHAVLADNADIVAAGFIVPVLLDIQGAELAEAVGGEKHLVRCLIAHHDLGPVHHGGKDKGQAVLAKGQRVAVLYGYPLGSGQGGEELLHHAKGFDVAHQCGSRVTLQETLNAAGVIRLHVLHYQVVRLPVSQQGGNVLQPLVLKMGIHRVHYGNFIVQNHIGVVGHSVGNHILPLKQIHLVVVDSHIADILCNHF